MRNRYPSQDYVAHKRRRLQRIKARATPELTDVFAGGKITLRQFDLASRLTPGEQRSKIARLNQAIENSRIAAKTIDELLNGSGGLVQLCEVARTIRETVADR
jgi:hypothetical protein